MNNCDWKNAFPTPTKGFHDKLAKTLDGLEREEKMKRLSIKKCIIIAAAVMVVGTAAIASSGTVRYITGSSLSRPDYTEVPAASELMKKIGASPKVLEQFSNGYVFESGHDVKNKLMDEEMGQISKYNSFGGAYKKDNDKILFSADAESEAHTGEELPPVAQTYNGVDIRYHSYTGKYVPADYELTEQDKIDEENGVVFSYGTDEIEIYDIQGVGWEQDGIYYNITAMNSPLGEEELIAMAKEVIDFQ